MHKGLPHYFADVVVAPSPIHGHGVFANRNFGAGEMLFEAVSEDVPLWATQSSSYDLASNSIAQMAYIPDVGYAYITELGALINHQTRCNSQLVLSGGVWHLQALRPIRSGEEITADYARIPEFLIRSTEGFKEL